MFYKKSMIIAGIALLMSLMTACHTVKGAGEDLQAGGEAISHAADKHSY